MRICPNCGGHTFIDRSIPQFVPPPVQQQGNVQASIPPSKRSRQPLRPGIPLVQARLLSKPVVSIVIAAVITIFALMLGGSDYMADRLANELTPDHQRQLTLSNDEYKQFIVRALPDDHPLSRQINRLGQILVAAISPESIYQYRFHVVESDTINAFAMPGGEIFILTGLVKKFPQPERVAAVLAHEIQHVEQRHSVKRIYRAIGRSALFGMALGIFTDQSSLAAVQLSTLKHDRANETQADLLGARLLEDAGGSRQAMVDMLNELAKEGGGGPVWLSSHPDSRERARRVADKRQQ